ncbi:methyl-accepting chemotaxis protein [Pseudomonas sp. GM25]|uniref:methyl-accepting chemotaxis protein n=1 Tax=Pseudomonas sp. GM25 TaxID=1144327 RepID=UPI00026FF417|nr:methyl-accepting chemotaxis protein [Pseudomonas sp. GM25]EJM27510.1 methyl-accepting chemotaxis protein [Pseudomonas sp. GM25]
MFFRKIKLVPRTLISFGITSLLLVILGWQSIWRMDSVQWAVTDLQDNCLPSVRQAARIEAAAYRLRVANLLFAVDDSQNFTARAEQVRKLRETLRSATAAYVPLIFGNEEQARFDIVNTNVDVFSQKIDQLLQLGESASQKELVAFIKANSAPAAEALLKSTEDLQSLMADRAEKSSTAARDEAHESTVTTAIVIAVALVVTFFLTLFFTRSVILPLRELLATTKKIAAGNLVGTVEVSGHDELTELQESTAEMLTSLKSTINHISESSSLLAASAEEMSAITHESNEGVRQQSMETELAATAVNEMTAAVEEVARNAVAASQSTRQSESSAQMGMDRVTETIVSIEKLSSAVQGTSVEIEQLANQTESIAKVLDVIRAIAEQTNLLALNAAIEAARAGEQGRGFAVVADEVRALAHRTQVSTQEIEEMIRNVQSGSEKAVSSMRQTDLEAISTLKIAREAGEAITEITRAVTDINERNCMIATASEEQAQVAKSVDVNLVSINNLSAQSTAAADQIFIASGELSALASDLNKLIGRFSL